MDENNPNQAESVTEFAPPARTNQVVEQGVTLDGMPFSVEAPPPVKKKKVIDVDVSDEIEEQRIVEFKTPPFVVFVVGGPGAGKGTLCEKVKEEFSLIHIRMDTLKEQEE